MEYEFDYTEENAEENQERFAIDSDGLADWAVQKIAEEEKEYQRLKEIAEEQISYIKAKLERAEERKDNKTAYLKGKLGEYFATVPHKATKTTETYKLLSGSLVMKNASQKIAHNDDEALIKYLAENDLTEFVKCKYSPAWAEFKKRLQIVDGNVVDTETGDVLEMLTVEESPAEFTIKF